MTNSKSETEYVRGRDQFENGQLRMPSECKWRGPGRSTDPVGARFPCFVRTTTSLCAEAPILLGRDCDAARENGNIFVEPLFIPNPDDWPPRVTVDSSKVRSPP